MLSIKIEEDIHLPVDVKIWNSAPMNFKYNSIKVISMNLNLISSSLLTNSSPLMEYLDFKPVENGLIEELLST